jgi:hypothetical protein
MSTAATATAMATRRAHVLEAGVRQMLERASPFG